MPTASSRWSASRQALAGLALCAAAGVQAQNPVPVIREIEFRGNEVTRPATMLREMTLQVGDPADPREVERSRQGVQDLGLFRSVDAELEPVEGGARLVITVKEKYYILPLPRGDISSDGGYGWGAQLRWNNVWGLNHTFNPLFERRQPSEGDADPEKRGLQTRFQFRYHAPFVFDSEYSLGFGGIYLDTPYLEPIRYDVTQTVYSADVSRKLTGGHGSQGWTAFSGLTWNEEVNTGPGAPPELGHALSASIGAFYRDLHFNVYSDEGTTYSFFVQSASEDISSDYNFTNWGVTYARYLNVGRAAHQNLNLLFEGRWRHDNDLDDFYAVGGNQSLRGFEPETEKGDAYYRVSVEYLRPVIRRSIRALFVVDAARAFAGPEDIDFDRINVGAGIGVRVRIQAFVAFDLELGIAWPLNGGSPRWFASKV
ncbi:MAG: POTRA domain-containing protein [Nevskiaceae bacterium]